MWLGPSMPFGKIDVLIAGGGPAGCAAALQLRRRFPDLSIAVFEAGQHNVFKPGEVLPAVAGQLLDSLGVMAEFTAAGFLRGRSVASAWDNSEPIERHGVFSAQGAGWHLDRARFDRLMLECVEQSGAKVRRSVTVRGATEVPNGWRIECSDGSSHEARILIWATGRRWGLARSLGARVTQHEPLVAYSRFFSATDCNGQMMIEARPEGWWYCAALPGERRVITCLTDPDIGRELQLSDGGAWNNLLGQTKSMRARGTELAATRRSAGTATIDPVCGENWLAAGDTLLAADPLSSRGIVHALRSGMLAAYAAADMMSGRGHEAATRLRTLHAHGLTHYRRKLDEHYRAAAQWDAPFWNRRVHRAASQPAGIHANEV